MAKTEMTHPLDNIIWKALNTRQADFARGFGAARKFIDDVGPLAGVPELNGEALESLAGLASGNSVVALFNAEPWAPRTRWKVVAEAPLLRMVREEPVPLEPSGISIQVLGGAQSAQMMELAHLVRPGPFGPRTHELGDYFGVFANGQLVAMAGERMKVPGYTEVSAVCTHPDHTGRGYAAAVMARVIAGIEARGETPFLHVRGDNDRAIALYERLGFRDQWSGHFAAICRE